MFHDDLWTDHWRKNRPPPEKIGSKNVTQSNGKHFCLPINAQASIHACFYWHIVTDPLPSFEHYDGLEFIAHSLGEFDSLVPYAVSLVSVSGIKKEQLTSPKAFLAALSSRELELLFELCTSSDSQEICISVLIRVFLEMEERTLPFENLRKVFLVFKRDWNERCKTLLPGVLLDELQLAQTMSRMQKQFGYTDIGGSVESPVGEGSTLIDVYNSDQWSAGILPGDKSTPISSRSFRRQPHWEDEGTQTFNYLEPRSVRKLTTNSIGCGAYSDVYLGVYYPVRGEPALKAIFRGVHLASEEDTRTINKRLYREARIWHTLVHPNVLPFFGLVYDPDLSLGCAALISPLCPDGDTTSYIQKYPNTTRIPIIKGVASGLCYLHGNDIVHGDLKPTNVLINELGVPVLCDFGRSRIITSRGYTSPVAGAQRYTAPELIELEDDSGPITKASNVFAYALVSLEVLTDLIPFHKIKNTMRVVNYILSRGRPMKSEYSQLSKEPESVWHIQEECWAAEPDARPTMNYVAERLRDLP
ncbi:kinase-like protein [Coprinopsis marcescibilis]|uniref:Kinase-like protein n=1 Tax=Coprinopsis marcescibilis TaxID=230819 RepID=A0A5C3KGK0_COPMA|nr:kinase-like protein [Coprinopsis marcescibilis]